MAFTKKKKKKKWFALCDHTIMDFMEMLIILHLDKGLQRFATDIVLENFETKSFPNKWETLQDIKCQAPVRYKV